MPPCVSPCFSAYFLAAASFALCLKLYIHFVIYSSVDTFLAFYTCVAFSYRSSLWCLSNVLSLEIGRGFFFLFSTWFIVLAQVYFFMCPFNCHDSREVLFPFFLKENVFLEMTSFSLCLGSIIFVLFGAKICLSISVPKNVVFTALKPRRCYIFTQQFSCYFSGNNPFL